MSTKVINNKWIIIACALAFPLVAAVFVTFFHFGGFGPWNDDYFFNTVNPASGEAMGWAVTSREPYQPATGKVGAWRPLLFTAITGLITLSWDQFWIARGVGAALHVLNCIMLYRAGRGFGMGVRPAAVAACIFLCSAACHEAWVWPSAYGSVTSAFLLQCVIAVMLSFARGFDAGKSRLWAVPLMMILVIIMLGFNEQATGALCALPFAYGAARGYIEPRRAGVTRALCATAAVCVLPPLYVLLVRATAQKGLGVDAETYVPLNHLWPRILQNTRHFGDAIVMRDFWYPAFALGWRALTSSLAVFWVWTTLLTIAAACTWKAWMFGRESGRADDGNISSEHNIIQLEAVRTRWWALLLFGIVAAFGATLPVAVIANYPANSRVTYVVLLMFLYGLLPVFHYADCWVERLMKGNGYALRGSAARWAGRVFTRVVGVALLVWMAAGGVMTIGTIERMRRTVAKDELNAQQLMLQVPNPAPGTVFLPVSIRPPVYTIEEIVILHPWMRPERIGRECDIRRPQVGGFHWQVRSVWEGLWSMKFFVKFAYKRNDVWCLYAAEGLRPVLDVNEKSVTFIWPFTVPYAQATPEKGGDFDAVIPIEKIVPITFDDRGDLRVISDLDVYRDGVLLRTVKMPQSASYRGDKAVRGRVDLGTE